MRDAAPRGDGGAGERVADGRPERFLGLSHQQGIALALIAVAAWWPVRRAAGEAAPTR